MCLNFWERELSLFTLLLTLHQDNSMTVNSVNNVFYPLMQKFNHVRTLNRRWNILHQNLKAHWNSER